MADKQIKEYDEQVTINSSDLFLLQSGTTDETLKTTADDLQDAMLAPGSVPWIDWTPTYTIAYVQLGNGTLTCRYKQIGKTVWWEYQLKFGSTTTSGFIIGTSDTAAPFFSVPVPQATRYANVAAAVAAVGSCAYFDASASKNFAGYAGLQGGYLNFNFYQTADSSYGIANTPAATYATGDILTASGCYEAA